MNRKLWSQIWKPKKPLSEESREKLLSTSPESPSTAKDVHVCECCGQIVGKNESPGVKQGTQWAIIICLLCTLVNCLVTIEGSCSNISVPIPIINKGQYDTLKRPSPFIGLDKIRRPSSPVPRAVLNYPQIIAQIDAKSPGKVFDDDPMRYMSHTGYVSPEDRRVKISPSISTIVQFRAIDFGMEECQLNVKVPANISSLGMNSSAKSFRLSAHRLETKQPINTKTLAYSNSPRRLTTVASIQVVPGSPLSWQDSFHCAWDDVLTFEIGCSDQEGYETDACSLEWWQNKEDDNPSHGIFLVQHSTI